MPIMATRFAADFGVEPSIEFQPDPQAPKRQERVRGTNELVWIVRALDANEEAARFGAEFKAKVAAPPQSVPPAKIQGFPYAPVLTITPYANNKGRIAHSFRAKGLRAPARDKASRTAERKTAA
ncbi:hypothetical protein [Kibdelosporangium phytohabitans]|uniref:Uncharacterized protein n=1 Tax=Kibdelosporangium phytohabitans TaxID=860235 RepID=A0A0N9IDZ0_9PSEU|nr:hypothetical protein [Kibdelosporangium phytohabitans]ALG13562.1 hypothetical protein AOZ06_47875 [Kibdelosporangium phytohabitans]MBE1465427.1 hypothetical protein [Kibdelosporangium phytohabitans]